MDNTGPAIQLRIDSQYIEEISLRTVGLAILWQMAFIMLIASKGALME